MSFNLSDILKALGNLAVTLDQHPIGAVSVVALTALLAIPLLVWLLR